MARRKPTLTPAPAETPPEVVTQTASDITYISNPISIVTDTPKTRDEIILRDAVRGRLLSVEQAIVDFIAEKEA